MENETERFWIYLLEKEKNHLEKQEMNKYYEDFQKLWKQKNNFEKVFDNLRKSNKIFFLIDKKWSILTGKDSFTINRNKSMRNYVFFEGLFDYFKEGEIKAYFGLGSANYFNQINWQSSHTFYIINEKYSTKRKIGNQTIILIKFPKEIFIENAILSKTTFEGQRFSDNEKTILDKIYYNEYKKGKLNLEIQEDIDFEKIKMYLHFYKKYLLVRIKLVSLLDEDQLKQLR